MNDNPIFISHGDITTDFIYHSNSNEIPQLLSMQGGGCNWNVLYHLSRMGNTCYAFGVAGNDEAGYIACNSLKAAGIDMKNVYTDNSKNTNVNHIVYYTGGHFTDSRYSPITGKCTVQFSNDLPVTLPKEMLEKNIYVILSRMFPINLEFIKNIPTKKVCLDIGSSGTIRELNINYILEFLQEVNVLLINSNVSKELLSKTNVTNMKEIFDRLSLDLLIETAGVEPVNFIFKNDGISQTLTLQPNIIEKPVNSIGAGDAFFSVIINAYNFCLSHNIPIDSKFVKTVFPIANSFSAEIVQIDGCRGEEELYKNWIKNIGKNQNTYAKSIQNQTYR